MYKQVQTKRSHKTNNERFWKYVTKSITGCWFWTAAKDKNGYGYFRFRNTDGSYRMMVAHRFSYQEKFGSIPDDLVLDHLACDNPSCVNPSHLFACSNATNVMRGKSPPAKNARKTHCNKGHALAGENLIVHGNGWRTCRLCKNIAWRKRYQKIHGLTENQLRPYMWMENNVH